MTFPMSQTGIIEAFLRLGGAMGTLGRRVSSLGGRPVVLRYEYE